MSYLAPHFCISWICFYNIVPPAFHSTIQFRSLSSTGLPEEIGKQPKTVSKSKQHSTANETKILKLFRGLSKLFLEQPTGNKLLKYRNYNFFALYFGFAES